MIPKDTKIIFYNNTNIRYIRYIELRDLIKMKSLFYVLPLFILFSIVSGRVFHISSGNSYGRRLKKARKACADEVGIPALEKCGDENGFRGYLPETTVERPSRYDIWNLHFSEYMRAWYKFIDFYTNFSKYFDIEIESFEHSYLGSETEKKDSYEATTTLYVFALFLTFFFQNGIFKKCQIGLIGLVGLIGIIILGLFIFLNAPFMIYVYRFGYALYFLSIHLFIIGTPLMCALAFMYECFRNSFRK